MTPTSIDILLLEDDATALELTQRALRRIDASLTIQVVTTGREALEFLGSRGAFAGTWPPPLPRLILLDLHVPHLNGLEVLQFLREEACCPDTPIVLFTSSENPKDIRIAYENHVDAYVVKPYSATEYAATLGRIVAFWLRAKRGAKAPSGEHTVRAG